MCCCVTSTCVARRIVSRPSGTRCRVGQNVQAIMMTGDTRFQTVVSICSQGISVLIKPFLAEELWER